MMMLLVPASYLRQGLLSNATTNAGLGIFLVVASGLLTRSFGLPSWFLLGAGLALGAFAALLAILSMRPAIPNAVVWAVIGFNLIWAADSLLLVSTGFVQPTRAGTVFVLAQAAVAAMYAGLQWRGRRQSLIQPG
jgi:hypothetical protein